jgi:carboxyl-terminal processing protease
MWAKKLSNYKVYISILLILILLICPTATVLAADNVLTEVRNLLQRSYIDPVSDYVLSAPSVDATLLRLGDPYTKYMNASEYHNFLKSIEDQSFIGIGISFEKVAEGVIVKGIIKGSPAEAAGLQKGDLIIEADGQVLAGFSVERVVSIIRGPEGSRVDLKIKRAGSVLTFTVERQEIRELTVTGEKLDGHTGYIRINSFGLTTPAVFADVIKKLRGQSVDSWIIDLRDNPGGYLSAALDLAGYFIGPNTAVQIQTRNKTRTNLAVAHEFVIDDPVIFLTNQNSASASEILAAAVKDYQKAVLVGARTYGKGTVQTVFDLSDGGMLKTTVARFFSPKDNAVNKVGILPDVPVLNTDAESAAEVLLSGANATNISDKSRYARFTCNSKQYEVSLNQVCKPEFWQSWGELIDGVSDAGLLQIGSSSGWINVTADMLSKRWPLYYPGYCQVGDLNDVPLDKKFTVNFQGQIDWQTVTENSVELINSKTGERVPLEFRPLDNSTVQVMSKLDASTGIRSELKPGTTYWLMLHQTIKDTKGSSLNHAALAVVKTTGSPVTVQILGARVKPQSEKVKPGKDYGQVILDLVH